MLEDTERCRSKQEHASDRQENRGRWLVHLGRRNGIAPMKVVL
jgi:hypothetical protein